MRKALEWFITFIPTTVVIIGLLSILLWLSIDPTRDYSPSEPGGDGYLATEGAAEDINIGEHFSHFSVKETNLKGIWPRFRGENSDNVYSSNSSLISSFNGEQPEILWSVQLGEGHAGAAIYNGLVYVLDYHEEKRADMLRCFSLTTGEEIWQRYYDVQIRRNHGMSRTVPAVTEKYIVTIGPRGHVMCVERETGNFLWGIDIEKEFESEVPLWYTGQCPIIENDIAIIATGGRSLMIGVDCATGEVLWETPNPNGWKMSHSSIMPYEFGGRKMYVYSAVGGAVGVAAQGDDAGKVLWETSQWNHPVVAASPVCMPDGKIFLSAGYGAGSMLIQLQESNGNFEVEILDSYRPGQGLSSEQQTPILVGDYMFGILPKDARTLRNQMVCVRADDPTEIVWLSGPTARFGLGPYILADNKFYLLNDDATLIIVQKSTEEYIELDRVKLFDGHDAWAPIAIADGYMVLRDSEKMICIDIGDGGRD